MTRNTHDRVLDHHNPDSTANVNLGSSTSSYASGVSLQSVISSLDDRITSTVVTTSPNTTDIGVIALNLLIGNGGGVIPTGIVYDIGFEQNCTITKWTLLADQSGNLVIDLWKDTYANFAPTVADTITASAKPTLSSQSKNTSSTLTGWTTSVKAGDIIRVNVDSSATVTRATLILKLQKVSSTMVAPPLIGGYTIFTPGFSQRVLVGLINNGNTIYSFTLARVAPPLIAPATTLFGPQVKITGLVNPPLIASNTTVFTLTGIGRVAPPLIASGTVVREPVINQA